MDKVEVAAPRELDAIRTDYNNTCAAAGDRQYRVEVLKSELQQLNQRLLDLNKEADAAGKAQVPSEQA